MIAPLQQTKFLEWPKTNQSPVFYNDPNSSLSQTHAWLNTRGGIAESVVSDRAQCDLGASLPFKASISASVKPGHQNQWSVTFRWSILQMVSWRCWELQVRWEGKCSAGHPVTLCLYSLQETSQQVVRQSSICQWAWNMFFSQVPLQNWISLHPLLGLQGLV